VRCELFSWHDQDFSRSEPRQASPEPSRTAWSLGVLIGGWAMAPHAELKARGWVPLALSCAQVSRIWQHPRPGLRTRFDRGFLWQSRLPSPHDDSRLPRAPSRPKRSLEARSGHRLISPPSPSEKSELADLAIRFFNYRPAGPISRGWKRQAVAHGIKHSSSKVGSIVDTRLRLVHVRAAANCP